MWGDSLRNLYVSLIGGGLSAAVCRRRKVFHIIPTGKEKGFSTFGKPSEKFLTMLKTVLKKLFHVKH